MDIKDYIKIEISNDEVKVYWNNFVDIPNLYYNCVKDNENLADNAYELILNIGKTRIPSYTYMNIDTFNTFKPVLIKALNDYLFNNKFKELINEV